MAFLKYLSLLLCAGALALAADPSPEANALWRDLNSAKPVPSLPPDWEKNPPQDQMIVRQTLRAETDRLLALAEKARHFAASYPEDPRHDAALQMAVQALKSAEKMGSPTARKTLIDFDTERLADPKITPPERLSIRMRQVQADAEALTQKSVADARDKFEEGARELTKEFPEQPAPWAMLLQSVDQGNDELSRAKLSAIANGEAPKSIKDHAAGILHRYDALGKPLEMKFTALDGREVDLATLRGKVVVIHFWAAWSKPCVEGIETIAKAYDTLRELGVEVIGINVDGDRAKVEEFIKDKHIAWPQYFEAGKSNRFAHEWGIAKLPAIWLVDRSGLLRDLEAQEGLSKKIETILSEKSASTP